MMGGKLIPIMFHIDDRLISHKHAYIIMLSIKKLQQEYIARDPLMVTRELVYEYLDITFDLRLSSQVMLTQYCYLINITMSYWMNSRLPTLKIDTRTIQHQGSM